MIQSSAKISKCGRYRYRLARRWAAGRLMVFVMLNPSTADASKDDPTIRRCCGFARREGHAGIDVVNLFAFRSTSPAGLLMTGDPIGAENDQAILDACRGAAQVVAAWGCSVSFGLKAPAPLRGRSQSVLDALSRHGRVWCFGKTGAGHPRHPLRLRGDTPLVLLIKDKR